MGRRRASLCGHGGPVTGAQEPCLLGWRGCARSERLGTPGWNHERPARPEDDWAVCISPRRFPMSDEGQSKPQTPLDILRHSTAHVMAKAVQRLFPGSMLAIGP